MKLVLFDLKCECVAFSRGKCDSGFTLDMDVCLGLKWPFLKKKNIKWSIFNVKIYMEYIFHVFTLKPVHGREKMR